MTTFIFVAWAAFWVYWLLAASTAKASTRTRRSRPAGALVIVVILLVRTLGTNSLTVHSTALKVVGVVLFVAGLALAVWARIYLGRNWGMPMTEREEPELVTSGPYRFVRHPIYSGILLAILGSGLATSLYWLIALPALGIYFVYSARVEERLMTTSFPSAYPGYKARTKLLIPFVL